MSYYLDRIRNGVDYVESRLDRPIRLAQVARAAGMSQWHFQRLFRSLTGETLGTYIRARRLSGALEQLSATDDPVLDVALSAGFGSQEAFARAFKRAFRVTPRQYRSQGSGGRFLKKLELDEAYLRHLQRGVSLTPEEVYRPAGLLVGLTTQFYGVDSDKSNLGRKLPALWGALLPRLSEIPNRSVECYGVIVPADTEQLDYFAAVEVSAVGAVPPGMVTVEVPEATWARFEHHGPAAEVDRTVSYAYGTWLPQSGRRHTGGPDLEVYGAAYHPTDPDSRFHYCLPLERS